jgi:hypothetical protein
VLAGLHDLHGIAILAGATAALLTETAESR